MRTALAKSPTHSHHASLYKHNALCYWNVFRIKLWYVKQFQWNANSHNTRKCEIYAIRSTWLISQTETNTWWVFKKKRGNKERESDRNNAETRSIWSHQVILRLEWKLVWKEQSNNKHERVESGKSVRRFAIRIELMLRLWIKHNVHFKDIQNQRNFFWKNEKKWLDGRTKKKSVVFAKNPYNHRSPVSCLPSENNTPNQNKQQTVQWRPFL